MARTMCKVKQGMGKQASAVLLKFVVLDKKVSVNCAVRARHIRNERRSVENQVKWLASREVKRRPPRLRQRAAPFFAWLKPNFAL